MSRFATGTTPYGYHTQRIIEEKILDALNTLTLDVSGVTGVYSGSGAPAADPGVAEAIYIDTDTGEQYQWFSGAWH